MRVFFRPPFHQAGFYGNRLAAPALKMDNLTDCFTCCFLNEASLISQTSLDCTTTAILHINIHFFLLSTSPCTKGREEPCLGKQRKGEITDKKKLKKLTWKHSIRLDQKVVYNKLQQRVEKSLSQHLSRTEAKRGL